MEKWIHLKELKKYPEADEAALQTALSACTAQVERQLPVFTDAFPGAAGEHNFYKPGPNTNWTTGFWTGEVWLAYEHEKEEEKRAQLLRAGNAQIMSFYERIKAHREVDHHDMGFLYSPSCVAGWKLTGSACGRAAAILAAKQLITRFQPVGRFLQAWGEMSARDNYRFIIDCLLNLPLLYWATDETGDPVYREIAEQHIHTAMAHVIRSDGSTWHTVFMNPETGVFDHGATCQGYRDGSAWARGQAWGVYGTAMAYRYTKRTEYITYFRRVTAYFLAHLPEDLCPFWDLTFGNGDEAEEPRDSSSAAIAACGLLEMSKYLKGDEAEACIRTARRLLKALIDGYEVKDPAISNGQLLHGTYSKKSPYNTCTPEGVDACVIWGDYFFMEALTRALKPDWASYW